MTTTTDARDHRVTVQLTVPESTRTALRVMAATRDCTQAQVVTDLIDHEASLRALPGTHAMPHDPLVEVDLPPDADLEIVRAVGVGVVAQCVGRASRAARLDLPAVAELVAEVVDGAREAGSHFVVIDDGVDDARETSLRVDYDPETGWRLSAARSVRPGRAGEA